MNKLIFLMITASAVVVGCSKDDSDSASSSSRRALLTAHPWKKTGFVLNGLDIFPFLDSCEIDNIITFVNNGTGTEDEGLTKCSPTSDQVSYFSWSLSSNETVLNISDSSGTTGNLDIISLTTDRMSLRIISVDSLSTDTILSTYSKL